MHVNEGSCATTTAKNEQITRKYFISTISNSQRNWNKTKGNHKLFGLNTEHSADW